MDYVTRQFIVLTKKLRKELRELLFTLHNDIQKQIEAIHKARNAYEQSHNSPQVLRAELQIPHPIEVETHPKEKKTGREWYKLVIDTLTLLGVLAYATVAVRQWREMLSVRHQTQQAIQAANRSAKAAEDANDYAVAANRPWIGQVDSGHDPTFAKGSDEKGKWVTFRNLFAFKNAGRRPASIEAIETTAQCGTTCTVNPAFSRSMTSCGDTFGGSMILPGGRNQTSHGIVMPDVQINSILGLPIGEEKWNLIQTETLKFCIYYRIQYRDVSFPKELHHSQGCRVLMPKVGPIFASCANNYDSAN